jgi:hypothetical protein
MTNVKKIKIETTVENFPPPLDFLTAKNNIRNVGNAVVRL